VDQSKLLIPALLMIEADAAFHGLDARTLESEGLALIHETQVRLG
jgi:hypothetical protein